MSETSKLLSERDFQQVIRKIYNSEDATISTGGFLNGKIGHKITVAIATTSVANDTEVYTYLDGSTQLSQYRIIYTDSTKAQLLSAERIS